MKTAIVLGGSRGIGKAIADSLKSIGCDVIATSKNELDTSSLENVLSFAEKHNQVDIALDPFPYSGITTSFESIWMGVPLYVLKGNNFYSRTGMSINKNLGMEDWIANNKKDYFIKILKLTSDFNKLSQTREHLINKVNDSTLFDSSLFANNFNKMLWKIWEKFTLKLTN